MVVVDFNKEFADCEAEVFLQSLSARVHLKTLSIGEDWKFGKKRRGDITCSGGGDSHGIRSTVVKR